METELERMVVRIMGDSSDYQKMLMDAQRQTAHATASIQQSATALERVGGSALNSFAQTAMSSLLPLIGVSSLLASAFRSVQLASEFEGNEISFGTMLKSAEAGKKMVRDLAQFAAETPMGTAEIQRAARLLLQFGTAGEDIIPTLRQIGDVTGGEAQKFLQIALAFGQMSATGRLMGQDLLQMINAGFNPLQEMARTTGKSVMQLKQEMERGLITVNMVKEAFRSATQAGGQFDGLMQKQSQSIGGLFSTMRDDIDALLRNIGFLIVDFFNLKEVMRSVSAAAQLATEAVKPLVDLVQSIPSPVRKAVGLMLSLAAGIAAVGIAWPWVVAGVGPVISALVGLVAAVATPLGVLVAGVVALGVAWVDSVGGAANAWASIKRTVAGFWDWVKPTVMEGVDYIKRTWNEVSAVAVDAWTKVRSAVGGFVAWAKPIFLAYVGAVSAWWRTIQFAGQVAWEMVKIAVEVYWNYVKFMFGAFTGLVTSVWDFVTGSARVTWTDVKDFIVDTFIIAEYTLRNFGKVIEWVWAGAKYQFVKTIEEWKYTFTTVLPTLFQWFADAIPAMFRDVHTYVGQVFTGLADNATRALARIVVGIQQFLDDPSQGVVINTEGMWQPLGAEFRTTLRAVPALAAREMGVLERQLRDEFERIGNALAEDFTAFRARRLREIAAFGGAAVTQGAQEEGANAGQQFGGAFTAAAGKEMQKFDAAARFSADALGRINDYLERLRRPLSPSSPSSLVAPPPSVQAPRINAGPGGPAAPAAQVNQPAPQHVPGAPQMPNIPPVRVPIELVPPVVPPMPVIPPIRVPIEFAVPDGGLQVALNALNLPAFEIPDDIRVEIDIGIGELADQTEKSIREVGDEIVAATRELKESIKSMSEQVTTTVRSIGDSVTTNLSAATDSVVRFFDRSGEQLAASIGGVGERLQVSIKEISDGFKESVGEVGDQLVTEIDEIGNQVVASTRNVGERLAASVDSITAEFNRTLDGIGNQIETSLGRIGDQIAESSRAVGDSIVDQVGVIGRATADAVGEVPAEIRLTVLGITDRVIAAIERLIDRTVDAITRGIQRVAEALTAMPAQLAGAAGNAAGGLLDRAAGLLGGAGPNQQPVGDCCERTLAALSPLAVLPGMTRTMVAMQDDFRGDERLSKVVMLLSSADDHLEQLVRRPQIVLRSGGLS